MSLEPIDNSIIYLIEEMLKSGETYKTIKKVCNVSDGTIARVKQRKITSDRVIKPLCNNREEELSYLYNLKKEENKKLILELEENKKIIENLKLKNENLKKDNEILKDLIFKEKDNSKFWEDKFKQLKLNFKALEDSRGINRPKKPLNSLKNDLEQSEKPNNLKECNYF